MTAVPAVHRSEHGPVATAERARKLTDPVLRATVGTLDSHVARIARYHLGWCEANGSPAGAGSGKGVRPALVMLAAEAVGAPAEAAAPGAAAVELIHNFSLLHDDVMDGDEYRRGRPTAWKVFGVPAAILVGDALQALAFAALLADPGPRMPEALRSLAWALNELVSGQHTDMLLARRPWQGPGEVTVPEYRAMAEAKTGSLLGLAGELGALLGGSSPEAALAFRSAGRHLGLAFQCADDVIGIWGDPARTGKPVLADLRERKKTLPVIAALATGAPAGQRLAQLLAASPLSELDLALAAELIEEAGGRRFAERQAHEQLAMGRRCLDSVQMSGSARNELDELIDFLVERVS